MAKTLIPRKPAAVKAAAKPVVDADAPPDAPLPFWKTKTLVEMNDDEWESLCDGCAKCCLVKLEDEDTAEVYYTGLHCKLLNSNTCQCSDYPNRKKYVPDCVKLTPQAIPELDWLPKTCAYRLVGEGKDLPEWHHLITGDRWDVHRSGFSALGRITSEEGVSDEEAFDYVIDWDKPLSTRRRVREKIGFRAPDADDPPKRRSPRAAAKGAARKGR
jgi:uncharacterized protein